VGGHAPEFNDDTSDEKTRMKTLRSWARLHKKEKRKKNCTSLRIRRSEDQKEKREIPQKLEWITQRQKKNSRKSSTTANTATSGI